MANLHSHIKNFILFAFLANIITYSIDAQAQSILQRKYISAGGMNCSPVTFYSANYNGGYPSPGDLEAAGAASVDGAITIACSGLGCRGRAGWGYEFTCQWQYAYVYQYCEEGEHVDPVSGACASCPDGTLFDIATGRCESICTEQEDYVDGQCMQKCETGTRDPVTLECPITCGPTETLVDGQCVECPNDNTSAGMPISFAYGADQACLGGCTFELSPTRTCVPSEGLCYGTLGNATGSACSSSPTGGGGPLTPPGTYTPPPPGPEAECLAQGLGYITYNGQTQCTSPSGAAPVTTSTTSTSTSTGLGLAPPGSPSAGTATTTNTTTTTQTTQTNTGAGVQQTTTTTQTTEYGTGETVTAVTETVSTLAPFMPGAPPVKTSETSTTTTTTTGADGEVIDIDTYTNPTIGGPSGYDPTPVLDEVGGTTPGAGTSGGTSGTGSSSGTGGTGTGESNTGSSSGTDENGNAISANCDEFACSGDPIQCAIARAQWLQYCDASKANPASDAAFSAIEEAPESAPGVFDLEVDVATAFAAEADKKMLGSASCMQSPSVSFMGRSYSMDVGNLCRLMELSGYILIALTTIAAARMIGT